MNRRPAAAPTAREARGDVATNPPAASPPERFEHGAWGPTGWGESGWERGGWGRTGWRHTGWAPVGHRRGPKNYRRADVRIREDICEALMARPDLEVSDVSVDVNDGVVTLHGTVPQRTMKYVVETLRRHAPASSTCATSSSIAGRCAGDAPALARRVRR
ncbi:MAG TPA: BON domain-containing protein [Burkholderiales bacterium]|nr:BON domain-containing protein [Burkholderiales bacterium]